MKTKFKLPQIAISLFGLCLLLFSNIATAQQIDISEKRKSLGQVVDYIKDGDNLFVFRGEGASAYGLFTGMAERHFLEYDMSSLVFTSESVVTEKQLKSAKINEQFFNLYRVGKKYFIVYSSEEKKNSGIYNVNIAPMTEQFELDLKKVVKVNFKTNATKDFDSYVLDNQYSDEIAILLTTSSRTADESESDDETMINFYNSDFELIRSVTIEKESREEISPIVITKSGTFYYTSTNVSGRKAKNRFQYDYVERKGFFIGHADIRGSESVSSKDEIATDDNNILSYKIRYKNDKIYIVTYNHLKKDNKLEECSLSYYQYDAIKGSNIVSNKYVLDGKILAKFYSQKDYQKVAKGKNPHGNTQIILKQLKFDNDQNMIVTGYKFRSYVVCTDKRCYTLYEEGSILVMKLSPQGDLLWTNVIPRLASSDGREYCTNYNYFISKKSNKIYFYYHDSEKNLNADKVDALKKFKISKSIVRVVVLNPKSGKIETSEVAVKGTKKALLSNISMDDGLNVEDVTDKAYFYFNGAHVDRVGTAELD